MSETKPAAPCLLGGNALDPRSAFCDDSVLCCLPSYVKSHYQSLQRQEPRHESPAKVFSYLKAKAEREKACINELTGKGTDMSCTSEENLRATFNVPQKEDMRITDKTLEKLGYDFHQNEVEPLTISPIRSPRKMLNNAFPEFSKYVQTSPPRKREKNSVKSRYACSPANRYVIRPLSIKSEQTAVPHPLNQIRSVPEKTLLHPMTYSDDFNMTYRTPRKSLPIHLRPTGDGCRWDAKVHDLRVSLEKLPMVSPLKMWDSVKERERKRKRQHQELDKDSICTSEAQDGGENVVQGHNNPLQCRQTCFDFSKDTMEDRANMGVLRIIPESSFPISQLKRNPHSLYTDDSQSDAVPSDMLSPATNQDPALTGDPLNDSVLSSVTKKWCFMTAEAAPLQSPAKVFAYLKERERKKQQQQEICEVNNCTRELRIKGHTCQPIDMPTITTPDMTESENNVCSKGLGCVPVIDFPTNQCMLEAADSLSERDLSEDGVLPAIQPQMMLEDPLVINSPRIVLSKKQKSTFKRKAESEATHRVVPKVTLIYLMNWKLGINNHGLFVEGNRKDNNIPWHSNIIVERVSSNVVKTVSGNCYNLIGKMKMNSELPKWFLQKFVNGFPINWKMYFDKFLAESRNTEAESTDIGRGKTKRTVPEKRTVNLSVQSIRSKASKRSSPPSVAASCPAETSHSLPGSMKLSRSGRLIKTPLEYWKGGRVTLDANMNITIHDSYETTICLPECTPLTMKASQRQHTPSSNDGRVKVIRNKEKSSVPLRKVKAPQRNHKKVKTKPDFSRSEDELPKESMNCNSDGPDEQALSTRSRQRHQARETALYAGSLPPSRVQPKRRSKEKSKIQSPCDTDISADVLPKQNIPIPAEPDTVCSKSSESDEDITIFRKKRRIHLRQRRKGRKDLQGPKSSHFVVSGESRSTSVVSGRSLGKSGTSRSFKVDNCNESSLQPIASPKMNKGHKNDKSSKSKSGNFVIPQDNLEDEWTKAELARLQEAVNACSKHKANYWVNVAMLVSTRSAEECQKQHTSQETSQVSTRRGRKSNKKEPTNKPAPEPPKITARVGTLKRKEQVRQLMEAMPKEDLEDAFTSSQMQLNRYEIGCITPHGKDHGLWFSGQEPLTPGNTNLYTVKTPQCLHISPGMMGSVNRKNNDKYVYQLQRRMKKNQVNGYKYSPSSKAISESPKNLIHTPKPSMRQKRKTCGQTEENDSFIVWKMFPDDDDDDETFAKSDEEEDFYFSDDN